MINWDEIINPKNWTEDCPMLNETYIKFFNSNKRYLTVFQDKVGNYGGAFSDKIPPEDAFIKAYDRGDLAVAIFERDFDIKADISHPFELKKALKLIDIEDWTKN